METISNLTIASEIKRTLPNTLGGVGLNVRKIENLNRVNFLDNPEIRITLCPLYNRGSLEESTLIAPPASIEDSRVHGKWQSAVSLVETLRDNLDQFMVRPRVTFTFADLGVISKLQDEATTQLLAFSEQLYVDAARTEMSALGVEFDFIRYSDIRSNFPRFIMPGGNMDRSFSSNRDMVEKINTMVGRLSQSGVVFANNFDRRIIEKMVSELGVKVTEGLLAQYGTFDAITTRDGVINTYFERSGLLLRVTDLFPHRERPRIDILC